MRLGVNIDHVATLRNARGGRHPDPIKAAIIAEESGADPKQTAANLWEWLLSLDQGAGDMLPYFPKLSRTFEKGPRDNHFSTLWCGRFGHDIRTF